MRKARKKQIEDFIKLLEQAHSEIKKNIETRDYQSAMGLLGQCQEGAVGVGNLIEKEEGEGFVTIPFVESYCELAYRIYEELQQGQEISGNGTYKKLRKSLIQIENSVRYDIKARLEIVFLPYKASMWDSLETVWQAADEDPDCDAYVVPIPYYDRNSDGSLGTYHYEGDELPEYVPVTRYDRYPLEEREPDIIYIHNPYDNANYVTSIDPRFYSDRLKQHTNCLVYIPYYSTAGGMSEGQASCPAYYNADYIVVQSKKFIHFFDAAVPEEKFLFLGSPKFDRVIRMCQNPPEPPENWKEKMEGRKVYFYNTSIGGMLGNTESFLKKMEYVFDCFEGREDACLLWRPHPLLESTFDSMRLHYYSEFKKLKQRFIESDLGIYDDTPDITDTIALSDVYVGDSGTSVTSLFGIVGKPLFILNNDINTAPALDDWRGQIIKGIYGEGGNKWIVTQGNKLYYSPKDNFQYEFYCDLNQYGWGNYYGRAIEINGKVYISPINAQDILVVRNHRIQKRIPLEHCMEQTGAFAGMCHMGKYLLLIPNRYPAIVRYDIEEDRVDYIKDYNEVFVKYVEGKRVIGGSCKWKNFMMLASPDDNHVIAVDSETGNVQFLTTGAGNSCGCAGMIPDGTDIWMLPFLGTTITRWNPETGEVREYSDVPEGFLCKSVPDNFDCLERPFGSVVFYKNYMYIAPCWGNMFLCLDKITGEIRQWNFPLPVPENRKNGYYNSWSVGYFVWCPEDIGKETYQFFSLRDAKLYDLNLETEAYREIPIEYDLEELKCHEQGFCEDSDWLQYMCWENCFNSLYGFLDGNVTGSPFDKEKQLKAYERIAANNDGTCGEKLHQYIRGRM